MKALSGYAEWFWLMAKGWKDVENRSWPLPSKVREQLPVRIYLHASKTKTPQYEIDDCILELLSDAEQAEFLKVDWSKYRGAIIGEITITRQVERKSPGWLTREGFVSDWFFGPYGFVLAHPVLYKTPISCKGKLGFFKPDIEVSDAR